MIKGLKSVFLYLALTIAVLQNWLWLAVILIIFFSLHHGAGALLPLAVVLDGYFGNFYTLPGLSIGAVFWYGLVSYVRPKLIELRIIENNESAKR